MYLHTVRETNQESVHKIIFGALGLIKIQSRSLLKLVYD